MLRPEEIERLRKIKTLLGEILTDPGGELRHDFAEKALAALERLCRYHGCWPLF